MTYYIYKIWPIIKESSFYGTYYIGQHTCDYTKNELENDVFIDNYYGSSSKLKNYYKKYGKNQYSVKKEILCFCNDVDDLNEKEKFFVGDLYNNDRLCLNLKAGGDHASMSDEQKQHLSKVAKEYFANDENRILISNKTKNGMQQMTDEKVEKMVNSRANTLKNKTIHEKEEIKKKKQSTWKNKSNNELLEIKNKKLSWYNSLSDNEKIKIREKIKDTRGEWTELDKSLLSKKISENTKKGFEKMSKEQINLMKLHNSDSNKKYWDSMSDEERINEIKRRSDKANKTIMNYTEEEKIIHDKNKIEGRKKAVNTMLNKTEEEKQLINKKRSESVKAAIKKRKEQGLPRYNKIYTDEEREQIRKKRSESIKKNWEKRKGIIKDT